MKNKLNFGCGPWVETYNLWPPPFFFPLNLVGAMLNIQQCCYYVVPYLDMTIMKWHYHRLYIAKSHCVQWRGNSRYSSKQLFLKSFSESLICGLICGVLRVPWYEPLDRHPACFRARSSWKLQTHMGSQGELSREPKLLLVHWNETLMSHHYLSIKYCTYIIIYIYI